MTEFKNRVFGCVEVSLVHCLMEKYMQRIKH